MQALLFLFLDILTCCLGFLNKYIYRVRTTFIFYKENALNTLKMKKKILSVSYHFYQEQ